MPNTPQRSFAAGELAPALFARADLARYAIGLRTCRNFVVMRAGGATKRPGTQLVDTAGVASAYILTLTSEVDVVAAHTVSVTASLTDFLGNPVTAFPCTFETDDPATATITATGSRTATVTGVADGTTQVRARIAALGVVSNNCAVVVSDFYVLHAFTGDAALNVTTGGVADRIVMIAGGGSGASVDGNGVGTGGGGAGEFMRLDATTDATDGTTFMTFTPGVYPVNIGAGGIHQTADHGLAGGVFGVVDGNNGSDTRFLGQTVKGGGGGGGRVADTSTAGFNRNGVGGGSGGGGASCGDGSFGTGGPSTINTLATPHGDGNAGAAGANDSSKGGGGGGGAQYPGDTAGQGIGGGGKLDDITGSMVEYARGGDGTGGANGSAGTGAGGCGQLAGLGHQGGDGGAGVVYVRYKASSGIVATGGIMTTFPV